MTTPALQLLVRQEITKLSPNFTLQELDLGPYILAWVDIAVNLANIILTEEKLKNLREIQVE